MKDRKRICNIDEAMERFPISPAEFLHSPIRRSKRHQKKNGERKRAKDYWVFNRIESIIRSANVKIIYRVIRRKCVEIYKYRARHAKISAILPTHGALWQTWQLCENIFASSAAIFIRAEFAIPKTHETKSAISCFIL